MLSKEDDKQTDSILEMSRTVRQIVRFIKRARNRFSSYYNLLRLKMYGVECGRHCVVHGKLYVHLFLRLK